MHLSFESVNRHILTAFSTESELASAIPGDLGELRRRTVRANAKWGGGHTKSRSEYYRYAPAVTLSDDFAKGLFANGSTTNRSFRSPFHGRRFPREPIRRQNNTRPKCTTGFEPTACNGYCKYYIISSAESRESAAK